MNSKVDSCFSEAEQWRSEMLKLRTILLSCGLGEDLKWGKPCYTFEGGNIVIIQGFKKYCALLFFKGALLKNPRGILVKTGVNTQVGRQIRFTSVREIVQSESAVKACVADAIEVEKAGLEVKVETEAVPIPEEFQNKMDEIPALRTAFEALTPGRQRAYLYFFSGAKQSQTRLARIEKWMGQIIDGKGMND